MSISPSQPAIVIGGTIAIDHVKTPEAEAANLLGGSAAYAALAASFFSKPVHLIGIIGCDFPQEHLEMLTRFGVTLDGVERSSHESFTWSGEYHENMNDRTTLRVGLNVLENWQVKVPATAAASEIVVLANMSPENQLEMLRQCQAIDRSHGNRFVIADTMDLWISIANEKLHEVLPHLDLFVLNEGEARDLTGSKNLVKAGKLILEKGPRHVIIKLGEFGAILFSATGEIFRSSAYPLDHVMDPTGAGDSFLGGLAGYLAAGGTTDVKAEDLRKAVIHASVLASFTCEAFSTHGLERIADGAVAARLAKFEEFTRW